MTNLDLDYVETLIRERFLFGKKDETIYIIKKDEKIDIQKKKIIQLIQ